MRGHGVSQLPVRQERAAVRRRRGVGRGRRAGAHGRRLPRPGACSTRPVDEGDGPEAADASASASRSSASSSCSIRRPRCWCCRAGAPCRVLTRTDVLAFLSPPAKAERAAMGDTEQRGGLGLRDPRHPRGPGRPTRRAARSSCRSRCRRRSPRTRSASTRASSTRRSRQPDPRRATRRAWPRSRARRTAAPSRRAWPPRTTCCACSRPGRPRACSATTPTAARSGSSPGSTGRPGITWTAVDLTDLDALRRDWPADTAHGVAGDADQPAAHRASTSRRWPRVAHERGALVVVDNTFATPYLQQPARARRRHRRALGHEVPRRPLRRGRRVRGRWTTTSSPSRLRFTQNAAGAVPAPFDCYLVLRGVKTLAVRMERHCANAARRRRPAARPSRGRAGALPAAARPSGPRRRAPSRCATSAAWCSFRRAGGEDAALEVVRRTELFTLAESLGAVESLIEHPGAHDPRLGGRLAARGAADAGAAVGRHRDRRRPRRRPGRRPSTSSTALASAVPAPPAADAEHGRAKHHVERRRSRRRRRAQERTVRVAGAVGGGRWRAVGSGGGGRCPGVGRPGPPR